MKKFLLLIAGALLAGTVVTAANNSMKAKALTPEHQQWLDAAAAVLEEELAEDPIMAVVYMTDKYPLYSQPGQQGDKLTELNSGTSVYIHDVAMTDSTEYMAGFDTWYQVSAWQGGVEYVGYVNRAHLAISDEDFLLWEMDFGTNPGAYEINLLDDVATVDYSDVEQFPASYQTYLRTLKDQHPNWIFVPQFTALDWNYVIGEELKGERSLIEISKGGYVYDNVHSPGWGFASREALEYYMDPRNGLTQERIFQFEQLTYNASYHTEEALKIFLNNTFMGNDALMPGTVLTYAHGIWAIGAEATQNVSPFHLAARIYQEQGQGTSPLISGTYPGYEGYYNFFNVRASGRTNEEIYVNGLTYAKEKGWSDGYRSILGGAKILTANYIKIGQDTAYLQKYDVLGATSNGLFGHQYMQNIVAPTSEGISTYRLYRDSNAVDNTFVFKIPVYENMPEAACTYPESATRVALEIPEGYSEAVIHVDGVAYAAEKRNGQFIAEIGHKDAKTAVLYNYDADGMPDGMKVWLLNYNGTYYQVEYVPEFDNILYYDGFSIRIAGNSGIRMVSGILSDTRNKLINNEVAGYELLEYGVLVLPERLLENYPLIKDGELVGKGVSYGFDASGNRVESIVDIDDTRHYFAAVLVGLPVEEYKTKFSFKSYVALMKNGEEVVIYGPQKKSSIYILADFMLQLAVYPDGSAEKAFLESIVADSDALDVQKDSMESVEMPQPTEAPAVTAAPQTTEQPAA